MSAEENLAAVDIEVGELLYQATVKYMDGIGPDGFCCGDLRGALNVLAEPLAEALFRLRDLED